MQCRMVELRYKEVINICDGSRLGYVGDVEVLLPEGRVTALVVPGPCRFFRTVWKRRGILCALGVHQADWGRYHSD